MPQPSPACTAASLAYAQTTLENIHNAFAVNTPMSLHLNGTDAIRLRHALTRNTPGKERSFFEEIAEAAATKGIARYSVPAGRAPFELALDTNTGKFTIERKINPKTTHRYDAQVAPMGADPSCAPGVTTGGVTPALNSAAIPRGANEFDQHALQGGLDQLRAGAQQLQDGTQAEPVRTASHTAKPPRLQT